MSYSEEAELDCLRKENQELRTMVDYYKSKEYESKTCCIDYEVEFNRAINDMGVLERKYKREIELLKAKLSMVEMIFGK